MTMEFTDKLPQEFLEALAALERESRALAARETEAVPRRTEKPASAERPKGREPAGDYAGASDTVLADYRQQLRGLVSADLDRMGEVYARLQRCKEQLALIDEAERSVTDPERCAAYAEKSHPQVTVDLDALLRGESNLISLAYRVNLALAPGWRRGRREACGNFAAAARLSRELLETEARRLRAAIDRSARDLQSQCGKAAAGTEGELLSAWASAQSAIASDARLRVRRDRSAASAAPDPADSETWKRDRGKLWEDFLTRFSPAKLLEAYKGIYAREPVYPGYSCPAAQPYRLHVADWEFDLAPLKLSEATRAFLERHYYFLLRGERLSFPCCVTLRSDFSWLLRYPEAARAEIADYACRLALRLFLLLPPRKAVLTFCDPASLGESFALFHRLVGAGGRNRAAIDGGIWSDPGDMEERLRLLTVHIAGVTQRCLQGKYRSLSDFNQAAGANAEPCRFLFLMDFPMGMSSRALTYLEQIAEFGPRCGVFPLLLSCEERLAQLPESFVPRVKALFSRLRSFWSAGAGLPLTCPDLQTEEIPGELRPLPLPEGAALDGMLAELRRGLEDAGTILTGAERFVAGPEESAGGSREAGLRVPIGLREANETLYLTLRPEAGQHLLLVARDKAEGAALLHTLLMNAMDRYRSPEELEIYLAEFRQGTAFQIYSEYSLPCFRLLSVKSEPAFGRSLLRAVEHELDIRADLFRRCGVENFAACRALPRDRVGLPLPRLLVVLDEFQELFAAGEDCRRSMERIVLEGAQSGVHLVLSARSLAGIPGAAERLYPGMWVRVALGCGAADGDLLFKNGAQETALLPEGIPGRGVCNSEAGEAGASVFFQALAYDTEAQREKLAALSVPPEESELPPTRILTADPADNCRSAFRSFPDTAPEPGRLYLGEPLDWEDLDICLSREEGSNLLLLGPDSELARGMFTYAMLSLLVNRRAAGAGPERSPWIYLLNYKPLRDRYFVDGPALLAQKLSGEIRSVPVGEPGAAAAALKELRDWMNRKKEAPGEPDRYLFLFGDQRALELRERGDETSPAALLETLVAEGPVRGVHTVLWHESLRSFSQTEPELLSRFRRRAAFQLTEEEFSQFLGYNDPAFMGEGTAVYDRFLTDARPFRPYRAPGAAWLEELCEKLREN